MTLNPEHKFDIARLLAREIYDELTDAERQRLDLWLAESEEHRALRDRLSDPQQLARRAEASCALDAQAAFRAFCNHKQLLAAKHRRSVLLRIAAAVVIAVTTLGGWYTFHVQTPAPEQLVAAAAGSRKAVLKLSDGRSIDLTEQKVALDESNGTGIQGNGNEGLVYQNDTTEKATSASEPIYNTLEVPANGEFFLQLADGTKVWVASCTTLRYPVQFSDSERRITLDGEAFFDVAPDKSKPFIVETRNYQVRAVGTSFNVMCYPDEPYSHTTLSSGCVECSSAGHLVRLKPGQQAYYTGDRVEVREVDTEMYTAWMGEMFMFDNEEIGAVMRKLSRWYGVRINLADGLSGKYHFRGSLPKYTDMSEALELLEHTTNIRFVGREGAVLVEAGSK